MMNKLKNDLIPQNSNRVKETVFNIDSLSTKVHRYRLKQARK